MMHGVAQTNWLLETCYAHRGLWRAGGAPENSLAAFEAAIRAQIGVELDVRLSADGEAVVFHDSALERMTRARGATSSRTAAELSRLQLLGSQETIPTLEQALYVLRDTPVLIELKVHYGVEGPLERRVAALIGDHPGPAALMSFNPASLAELAHLAPGIPRGQLCEGWRRGRAPLFPWARRAAVRAFLEAPYPRPDFLACEVGALKSFGRPAADALRAPLLAWTVRTRAQLERAERHADALIFEQLEPALVRPSLESALA
jgi:glycerophosphoryl diester phosphodiesterase